MRIVKTLALAIVGGMFLLSTAYLAEEQPAAETNVSSNISPRSLYPLPLSVGPGPWLFQRRVW